MTEAMQSLFSDAHRKLVAGTEVLRTGGGATLSSGECNAILDRLSEADAWKQALQDVVDANPWTHAQDVAEKAFARLTDGAT